jgi:hypothetical protein
MESYIIIGLLVAVLVVSCFIAAKKSETTPLSVQVTQTQPSPPLLSYGYKNNLVILPSVGSVTTTVTIPANTFGSSLVWYSTPAPEDVYPVPNPIVIPNVLLSMSLNNKYGPSGIETSTWSVYNGYSQDENSISFGDYAEFQGFYPQLAAFNEDNVVTITAYLDTPSPLTLSLNYALAGLGFTGFIGSIFGGP